MPATLPQIAREGRGTGFGEGAGRGPCEGEGRAEAGVARQADRRGSNKGRAGPGVAYTGRAGPGRAEIISSPE